MRSTRQQEPGKKASRAKAVGGKTSTGRSAITKTMPSGPVPAVVKSDDQPNATLVNLVRSQLLRQIIEHFSPNLRLPPIYQIAEDFGIGVGTANLVIKDLASAGILVSRQRLGTSLAPGCRIEHLREQLEADPVRAQRRTGAAAGKRIRILMSETTDAMVVEISDSFARAVARQGCKVTFGPYPARRIEWARGDDRDATVLLQPDSTEDPIPWNIAEPVLVVGTRRVYINQSTRYDLLSIDDEQGSYLAGQRLRAAGCTSACFIGGRRSRHILNEFGDIALRRLAGFERGWGEPLPESHRLLAGSYDIESGAVIVPRFVKLSPRPQAVFCASDDLAIGFVIGCQSHGLQAGRDYQLVGFDRQERALEAPGGPMTSVEVPRQALGLRGAELLLSRLADLDQPPRHVYLGCTLFEGRTVHPVVTPAAR